MTEHIPSHQDEPEAPGAQPPAPFRKPSIELPRFSQQAAGKEFWTLDAEEALCVPTAFYTLGLVNGYLKPSEGQSLPEFMRRVDWQSRSEAGWSRPAFADHLRQEYSMSVVSWQVGRNTLESLTSDNLQGMHAAGYIDTPREEEYFQQNVVGKDISEIVADTPVIVSVKPGFGTNRAQHVVIIDQWDNAGVHVVDPDERNRQAWYSDRNMRDNLTGACSIVLPRENGVTDDASVQTLEDEVKRVFPPKDDPEYTY